MFAISSNFLQKRNDNFTAHRMQMVTNFTFQKAKLLANKKAEGNDAFKHNHTQKAYDLYSEALEIDPNNRRTNAKLFCNRALVGSKVRIC